ncbi:MAG: hypothetical protein M1836_002144 [Candelina mexicana]|nr:MAG: hypothetical protein M1836_002144 [Candelina mexicana]
MHPQAVTAPASVEIAPAEGTQRVINRSRAVVPIVPAVPLAFERKSRPKQPEVKPVTNGTTSITPPSSTATDGQREGDMRAKVESSPMIVNGTTHPIGHGVGRALDLPVVADSENSHFDQGWFMGAYPLFPHVPGPESVIVSPITGESTRHSATVNPGHIYPTPLHPAYQVTPSFQSTNYPSAPSSAGSSTFPPYPPHFNHAPLHHPHPSNGNLVFGGYPESNNPSPGPVVTPATSVYPLHFSNGSTNPHFQQPPYPLGHMHNGSDPPAPLVYPHQPQRYNHHSRTYHRHQYRNHNEPNPQRRLPSFHAPAHQSIPSSSGTPVSDPVPRPLAREPAVMLSEFAELNDIVLRATPPLIYHSSHSSQDSAVQVNQRESPVIEGLQLNEQPIYQNGESTIASHPDPFNNTANSYGRRHGDAELMDYLRSMFGDIDLADYVIEVRDAGGRLGNCRFFVHGILAARSPTVRQHMCWLLRRLTDADYDNQQRKIIRLVTTDRFLRYDAFELALKHLYGYGLLHDGHPAIASPHHGHSDDHAISTWGKDEEHMEFALAYAAAGHLLQLFNVTSAGVKLVSALLKWETIEKALAFAMDGLRDIAAISMTSMPARSLTETGADMEAFSKDGSTNPAVPVSSNLPQPLAAVYGASATYAPFSQELLYDVLHFIISEFPPLFELDTDAPQLASYSRLPAAVETRSPTSSSRLCRIQFGDHPAQDTGRPSFGITLLSKILLSLPLPLLKYVLESESLGEPHSPVPRDVRLHIAESVITEREKRRLRALRCRNVSDEQREADKESWDTVGWQEEVDTAEADQAVGFRLIRNWKGFHHPVTPGEV